MTQGNSNDSLGLRMKNQYEFRTRYLLPRRTYTIIRLDGKAFHTYTRNCEKPYDKYLSLAMNITLHSLVQSIQGTVFGYTQSDEISLLLTDFGSINTEAWYDGNLQKIVSVAASIATASFNNVRASQGYRDDYGLFDARAFIIPDRIEVMNYFIWRQKDCIRNSISGLAQKYYSHKELHGKNQSDMQGMIVDAEDNWAGWPEGFKNGRLVYEHVISDAEVWTQSDQLQLMIPQYPNIGEN